MKAPKVKIPNPRCEQDHREYDPNVWRIIHDCPGPFTPLVKIRYVLLGQPCELLETDNYPFYGVNYLFADHPYWLLPEQVDIRQGLATG